MTAALTIAIIAKQCLPGRVKTRLARDLGKEDAAALAAASLADTIAVVEGLDVDRRVLFFQGDAPRGVRVRGFEVLAQPDGGLDERLGFLFDTVDGALLLIGMDTPQLTAAHVAGPLGDVDGAVDAWFGPAVDGGFWGLAMSRPDGSLIRGVPMSRADTGRIQRSRLIEAGLTVGGMPVLRDVDWIDDAREVADIAPTTRFAREWRRLGVDAPLTRADARLLDDAIPTRGWSHR